MSEGLGIDFKEIALCGVEIIFIVADNIVVVQLDILVVNGVVDHIRQWHLHIQPKVFINTFRNQLLIRNLEFTNFNINVFHF